MKILCVFIQNGGEKYPNSLAELDAWYAKHGLLQERELRIIDNSLPSGSPIIRLGTRTRIQPGDNSAWEFSSWRKAIQDELDQNDQHYTLVHCVTSAFNTLYTRYLDHFSPWMLKLVDERKMALGHVDTFPSPMRFENRAVESWIRSCFFFLPWDDALPSKRSWVRFNSREQLFVSENNCSFLPQGPFSRELQEHFTGWLLGRERGGHVWHSPIDFSSPTDLSHFQSKCLAIANEQAFSANLRDQGLPICDYCWLWHQSPEKELSVPTIKEQIQFRNRYLNIPETP